MRTSLLIVAGVMIANSALGQVPEEERQALIDFYHATGGEEWHNNDGWLGDEGTECDWHGVTCIVTQGHQHVEELVLDDNGLAGELPESLSGLSQLRQLLLTENALSGTIPDDLWGLDTLDYLEIRDNAFGGSIPARILGLASRDLDLSDNRFSGFRSSESPVDADSMYRELDLSGNRLGELPPEGWMTGSGFVALNLASNQISGTIDLSVLDAGMEFLDMSHNAVTDIAGFELTQLNALYLAGNRLSGSLPDWLDSESLDVVDLSFNQLSGDVPPFMAGLDLWVLDVRGNQLTGSIDTLLEASSGTGWLLLADNLFEGTLPIDFDYSGFNQVGSSNFYHDLITRFGIQGLDLCWNELAIPAEKLEEISSVHASGRPEECLGRDRTPINPSISGSWFSPQRSGEGLAQMLLDNGHVLTYWFTYPTSPQSTNPAEQMWMLGVSSPDELSIRADRLEIPVNGRFSQGLTGDAHLSEFPIIDIRQDRLDETAIHLAYENQTGWICITGFCSWEVYAGRHDLTQLTQLAGTTCDNQRRQTQEFSGAWYNPERAGEGFIVEVLSDGKAVVYWFTYKPDDSGKQAWMIGVGEARWVMPMPPSETNVSLTFDEIYQPVGGQFGPAFDPADVEMVEWGELSMHFQAADFGEVHWDSHLEEYGSGSYPIERLARPMLAECDGDQSR